MSRPPDPIDEYEHGGTRNCYAERQLNPAALQEDGGETENELTQKVLTAYADHLVAVMLRGHFDVDWHFHSLRHFDVDDLTRHDGHELVVEVGEQRSGGRLDGGLVDVEQQTGQEGHEHEQDVDEHVARLFVERVRLCVCIWIRVI